MAGAEPSLPAKLPLRRLPRGETFFRIHLARHRPLWFGPARGEPPTNRFDDPSGVYRVCYLGCSVEAAFVEKLLRAPPVRVLSRRALAAFHLTRIMAVRQLRVVSLHGPGLARLGLTATIATGQAYADSRTWARRIHEHPEEPDGILYRCRHDDDTFAVALFDRARSAVNAAAGGSVRLDEDPSQLTSVAQRYGFGLTLE